MTDGVKMRPREDTSSQTLIKICGITNVSDAEGCVAMGAHFLGFNFYRQSQRFIAVQDARRISERLPKAVGRIGVFVNAMPEDVLTAVASARLDGVQLHGDETADECRALHAVLPASCCLIRAVRVHRKFQPEDVQAFGVSAVLLDAWQADSYGGTGQTCDWNLALATRTVVPRLFLAGGLTPENVEEAVRIVRPFAVDVCSGVEIAPGRKSFKKVERFIASVCRANEMWEASKQ